MEGYPRVGQTGKISQIYVGSNANLPLALPKIGGRRPSTVRQRARGSLWIYPQGS
jgi:hypothetical protein